MKTLISIAATATLFLAVPAFADNAQTLSIKDFVGTVNIITGDDFSVTGEKSGITEIRDGGLIIDGGEVINNSSCKNMNGNIELSFGKKSWFKRIGGYKNLDEYPKLDITVPAGSRLNIRDSVIFGAGEDFSEVDANIMSCGNLKIGNVAGELTLNVSGSGDFTAENVGPASVRISGSGDVSLGDMQTAVLRVAGSGDLEAGNVNGAAKITTSGSGDIELSEMTGALVYEGRGSSDLKLTRLDGRASITVTGSGNVDIEDGDIPELLITSRGSSEFDFGGTAGDVTAMSSGSGHIDINDATGEREVKVSGSADVEIGGKRYDD